jgi:hypothetical protein
MNQTKTTPKDFFLHLGATIALYTAVIALINLYFTVINYYFPDALAGYYFSSSIAWPVSMLIVVIPILYILEWLIKKDIRSMPDKSEVWIRRWRIYLTLFLGGIVIAGDLISLINTYLNGEISIRFVYKFLVILIVTSIVFAYYIFEKIGKYNKARVVLSCVAILIALIGIVLGFMIVGSPTKQRSIRFDNQRVSDLQNIQWQIVNYWQQKGKLPNSLDEVKDPISGVTIPVDPESNNPYKYSVINATKFELCATFDLDQQDIKGRGEFGYGGGPVFTDMAYPIVPENVNWMHSAGNVCFERTIDPDKYPIYKK